MTPRRTTPPHPQAGSRHPAPADDIFLRQIERKRRRLARLSAVSWFPTPLLAAITHSSFRLESLAVTEADVFAALSADAGSRAFRPPQLLRIRNHVAILRAIERTGRNASPLKASSIVRWYTSISCGLSSPVPVSRMLRLEQVLRRVNSPQLRIQQAVPEIALLHCELLTDPLFPGFNGMLSRLMLQYHLSRCNLPPVWFDPQPNAPANGFPPQPSSLAPQLMQQLLRSYDLLLTTRP